MATLMANILGCNTIDEYPLNAATSGLSKKYGKSFVISALGDRFNSDTATLYLYPDDDPTLRFVARVNTNKEIVFENYSFRLVCHKVEKTVKDVFSKHELNAECFAEFSCSNFDVPADITVEDFILEKSPDSITIPILIKSDSKISGEELETICREIDTQIPEIVMNITLFILTEKDYEKVCEQVKVTTQLFAMTRLRAFGAEDDIKSLYIQISDNKLSITANDINKMLSGEV